MTTSTDLRITDPGGHLINFFERRLYYPTADRGRRPFLLTDWQAARYRKLYGTLGPNGLRQFRRAFIAEGKKNGKTAECSGLVSYHIYPEGNGEFGAEAYSGAASRDQAGLVYRAVKQMIVQSPRLRPRARFYDREKRIYIPENESFYLALSADADYSDGINPSLFILDEVHRHKNPDIYDLAKHGSDTRAEPMMVVITTAGEDRSHFLHDEWEYARKVRDGVVVNDEMYVEIHEVPMDADPFDERNWYLANPALGDFLDLEKFRGKATEAMENPRAEGSFRRLRLNQWVSSAAKWINRQHWDQCAGVAPNPAKLKGRRCFAGIDLGESNDFAALALLFPWPDDDLRRRKYGAGYDVLLKLYLPADSVTAKRKAMKGLIRTWAKQGFIELHRGAVVEHDRIMEDVVQASLDYELVECGYDPWKMKQIEGKLSERHITMAPVKQSPQTMNEPCRKLEQLLAHRQLNHGGNPVLTWMADNAVAVTDSSGCMRPDKQKSADKIDGLTATIVALERAMAPPAVKFAGVVT